MVKSGTLPATGRDALETLVDDHRQIKALFSKLSGAPEMSDRANVLEELKHVLALHNATEENVVYPAIAVLASRRSDAVTLYHQQDQAELGLWELDAMAAGSLGDGDFDANLADLERAVAAHIRKEEETEFPHLREALGQEGLAGLTEAVDSFRSTFGAQV